MQGDGITQGHVHQEVGITTCHLRVFVLQFPNCGYRLTWCYSFQTVDMGIDLGLIVNFQKFIVLEKIE